MNKMRAIHAQKAGARKVAMGFFAASYRLNKQIEDARKQLLEKLDPNWSKTNAPETHVGRDAGSSG
jgi:hypothetical protein